MKIVHLCLCGIFDQSYAYHENLLAKYHKKMGHDVTIIAPTYSRFDSNGIMLEESSGTSFLQDGIKLIRVKPLIRNYRLNSHLHIFHDCFDILLAEHADLIFTHDVFSWNYRCLSKVHKISPKTKFAFDNHADYVNSLHSPISKFLNRYVYRYFVNNRLKKLSDFFYGVTPARCDFLHDVYGISKEKIHLLVMGADDEEMFISQKNDIRMRVRRQFQIDPTDFLIVTGGRIDIKKNIHKLVSAVSSMKDSKIKILFFGSISDDLKGYLYGMLSDRIKYAGWVPSNRVYDYFFAADLVVFPGLHSVLWEQAVASRIPCAFSRIDGFDHVNFNGNCIFLDKMSEEYYVEVIEEIYKSHSLYNDLLRKSNGEGANQFLYSNIALKVISDSFPDIKNKMIIRM